jgi:hypothetical protein
MTMEDSNQLVVSAGHLQSGTGDIKRTFWVAREAQKLAAYASTAPNVGSGDLVRVSFDVCVEVDYVNYHEAAAEYVKRTLNTNLVSTCTGTSVRLEHKIDPIVTFLDKESTRFYRVIGQVLYRVK